MMSAPEIHVPARDLAAALAERTSSELVQLRRDLPEAMRPPADLVVAQVQHRIQPWRTATPTRALRPRTTGD